MSKYNSKKTERLINGEKVICPLTKEASRYDELLIMLKSNKISALTLQPIYEILPQVKVAGHRTMPRRRYIPDFKYIRDKQIIVEDVKGFKTPIYNLKKQLFLKIYGDKLTFIEVF